MLTATCIGAKTGGGERLPEASLSCAVAACGHTPSRESERPPKGGHGNPLQYSCLENLRGGGAWWAAIYGVAGVAFQAPPGSQASSRGDQPGARHVSHTPAACSFPGENARSWEARTTSPGLLSTSPCRWGQRVGAGM